MYVLENHVFVALVYGFLCFLIFWRMGTNRESSYYQLQTPLAYSRVALYAVLQENSAFLKASKYLHPKFVDIIKYF
jgi:hypothetical protein